MDQRLTAGGMLDLLTKDELDMAMGHNFDAAIRDIYRGIDYMTFTGYNPSSANGPFTIPYTPDSGYCWSVKILGFTLSATGNYGVFMGANTALAPVAIGTAGFQNTGVVTWSANQLVMKDQQSLTILGTAANVQNFILTVKQVPVEMQGKL
jgi:hypothetical protein